MWLIIEMWFLQMIELELRSSFSFSVSLHRTQLNFAWKQPNT